MVNLESLIDDFMGNDDHNMRRSRPYDGQPWTDAGIRGKTEVKGITFRDLQDCFLRSIFLASSDQNHAAYEEACKGEEAIVTWNDAYALDFNKIDIRAIAQNLSCEIEKVMGIFPNIPKEIKL
jgi:hypothetical protein